MNNNFGPLPSSIETEQAVLGASINNINALIEVQNIISVDDFYVDKHKKIFSIVSSMANRNIGIDLVTLLEEIRKKEILTECGGVTYITELASNFISSVNITAYANIVKEKSDRRRLIKASKDLLDRAYNTEDIKDIIDKTENDIYNISNSQCSDDISKIEDVVNESLIKIEERYNNGGKITGVTTGFSEVDKLTSGLKEGALTIIAARPSMGKTAFALNVGQAASKNANVAIFSLEMSKDELMERMLSAKCLIEFERITLGNFKDEEFEKIMEGANDISKRKLFIDDMSTLLGDIKAKCRKLKIQNGLDVVIIDYLQLVRTTLKVQREQEVSHISRELKSLAKELHINIIALAQLSRACEQRPDHRPMLSDLRESGSIEQDADVVHFLYRDEYYNKETEDKNIAELITGKNRNGQTGTTKLCWLGQYQRFGTLDTIRR